MAKTTESEQVPPRRAYQAAWYLAHRASHRARSNARYRAHRSDVIARVRRYRTTAAGMLADLRHAAAQRGTR